MNQGWICERSKAFIEHLYHEDRLNYPLKRIGQRGAGKWQRVSWDDALDEVAEKLDGIKTRSGAEAVASIGGTGRGFSELFKVRFATRPPGPLPSVLYCAEFILSKLFKKIKTK